LNEDEEEENDLIECLVGVSDGLKKRRVVLLNVKRRRRNGVWCY
jgi:hypothetical protein